MMLSKDFISVFVSEILSRNRKNKLTEFNKKTIQINKWNRKRQTLLFLLSTMKIFHGYQNYSYKDCKKNVTKNIKAETVGWIA